MKFIYTLLLGCAALGAMAAPVVEKPTRQDISVAFAIITDNATYQATRPAMMRYRDAVQNDGLAAYIVRDDWKSPQDVKDAIKKVYSEAPGLEGIVLVGDVPVAMVRNAQHMTTAFKMNEDKFPFIESSVPSDRFYDCLDMDFRFLKQDEEQPHLFYYELTEDSPQRLNPTFYSARIRYPKLRGGDKYEAVARFLDKAAKAKEAMKNDRLDRVVSFNGHGYNSDCLIAWMDEEKAYRENFPLAFNTATDFKHWNFRMMHPMKYKLFDELQRPEVDLFMFHEHGAPTTQYINGSKPAMSDKDRYDLLKKSIYSRVRRAIKKGNPENEVVEAFAKEYALTDDFFKDLNNPEYWRSDSIESSEINIEAEDFHHRTTWPKIVMFDACYNGSFHEDDYIAGEYLFNDGGTLAAQGNTRNVLQDRWTIEMIGLLSHGMRVGQYNRLVATLEGHLMGDPTLRFAPVEANTMSADATLRKTDTDYWKGLLGSPYADVQSLALRMLADADTDRILSPMLLEVYRTSPFNTVRMEAVKLLSRYNNSDFTEAVRLGINDPYELVARLSADHAGNIGDPSLLPALIFLYIDGNERARAAYNASNSLSLFPIDDVVKAVEDYYASSNRYNAVAEKERVINGLKRTHNNFVKRTNDEIADTTLSDDKRISSIRFVRNNPYHPYLDLYLGIIEDSANSDAVRVTMAEALGWFNHSVRRQEIIDFCNRMLKRDDLPDSLSAELLQTINRMQN